jgi:DNA polymerase-4
MDYFFAQVEERDNPSLRGKPVAIGCIMNGRGVLSTSNYEARKYGVRAAMPTALALKKCPHLILVGSHFEKYREASAIIFEVFKRFTDKIESISLDEAYLDVTDCHLFNNDAVAIAKEVKKHIFQETRLTASAGISYNKLLAKIGSDLHKPNGIAVIRPENVVVNISRFPISKIWGCRKSNSSTNE